MDRKCKSQNGFSHSLGPERSPANDRFRDANYHTMVTPMSSIDHSVATLRFLGDDLVPETVSAKLGAQPTTACRKGQEIVGPKTGVARIAKVGSWRLEATRREPEDLEAQVFELLNQLTSDLSAWKSLSHFKPELFCGIFMRSSNDGMDLSALALHALGQRGIALGLDIYDSNGD